MGRASHSYSAIPQPPALFHPVYGWKLFPSYTSERDSQRKAGINLHPDLGTPHPGHTHTHRHGLQTARSPTSRLLWGTHTTGHGQRGSITHTLPTCTPRNTLTPGAPGFPPGSATPATSVVGTVKRFGERRLTTYTRRPGGGQHSPAEHGGARGTWSHLRDSGSGTRPPIPRLSHPCKARKATGVPVLCSLPWGSTNAESAAASPWPGLPDAAQDLLPPPRRTQGRGSSAAKSRDSASAARWVPPPSTHLGAPPQEVAGEAQNDLRVQTERPHLQQTGRLAGRAAGRLGRPGQRHGGAERGQLPGAPPAAAAAASQPARSLAARSPPPHPAPRRAARQAPVIGGPRPRPLRSLRAARPRAPAPPARAPTAPPPPGRQARHQTCGPKEERRGPRGRTRQRAKDPGSTAPALRPPAGRPGP